MLSTASTLCYAAGHRRAARRRWPSAGAVSTSKPSASGAAGSGPAGQVGREAGGAIFAASRPSDVATVLIQPQKGAPPAQTVRPRLQWTVRAMKAQRWLQPIDVSDAAPRGQGPASQPRRLPPLPPCSSAKLQHRAKELRSRRKSPQPRLGWRLNKPAQWRISFSQYVAGPLTMYALRPAAQAPRFCQSAGGHGSTAPDSGARTGAHRRRGRCRCHRATNGRAAVRSTGPVIRRRNVQLRVKPLIIGK